MSLDYRNIEITEEIFNSPEYTEYRKERLKVFRNCGVYFIINLVNNHIYIGSSSTLDKRFAQHKSDLRHNKHFNKHLQRAWNKYGEDNFEFQIKEHHAYPEDIKKRENKNIYLFKPEYNSILVNNENRLEFSEETRKKMSIAKKGKSTWNKGLKLSPLSETTKKKLSNTLKGRRKGDMSDKQKSDISRTLMGRKISKEQYERLILYRKEKSGANHIMAKKVYQYDLSGNFIKEWNYIKETEELGISPTQVSACLSGKHKTAYGNRWYYDYKGEKIEPMILSKYQINAIKGNKLTLS